MDYAYILASCNSLRGLVTFIEENVNVPLKIIAVVAFFIFTTLEYAKVVFNNDGSPKQANEKTLKRFVGLLFLFFAPNIINLILKFVDVTTCKV